MTGSTPDPLPLSLHDHLAFAQQHVNAAIQCLDINHAFRVAAFEQRISQYGNIVLKVDRLKRVLEEIKQIQAHNQAR